MTEEKVTIKLTKAIERVLTIPDYPNKWCVGTRFEARRSINGWIVTNGPDAGLSVPADCAMIVTDDAPGIWWAEADGRR